MIQNRKWWKKGEEEPHKALFNWVSVVEDQQVSRRERNKDNLSRYLNQHIAGLRPGDIQTMQTALQNLTLNVTNSIITAITARITAQRPYPYILTENGKFEDQERAKLLQKFVKGVLSQNDVHDESMPTALTDSTIFGDGFIKTFRCEGKIKIERVLPDEILVDEIEAHSASPRNLGQLKWVTRDSLKARFPKFKAEIDLAKSRFNYATQDLTDMVEVVEAWHLPSGKDTNDGRHIIAIDQATLLIEPWTRDRFPITKISGQKRQFGYYSQGIAEKLAPIQDEIDKVVQRIQECMHLLAVAWVIVDTSSGIKKRHLKNVNAIILEKTGGPDPKVQLNAGVNPQWFEYVEYLYQKAYQLSQVSELSAQAKRPEGLRSGAAIRTFLDSESSGWTYLIRQYERAAVDIARCIIAEAREAHEEGEEISVNSCDREWFERIKFGGCNMDDDRFTIDVHPTSHLPTTPSGKLELISELSSVGAITDPAVAMDLLNMPDVDKFTSVETAPQKVAHRICEYILSGDNNYIAPEEFMDLQVCVSVANKYWNKALLDKVPQKRIDNLARFIVGAMDILNPQPLPPGPMDPAMAMPQAMAPAPVPGVPAPEAPEMPMDPSMLPPGVLPQ